MWSPTHVQVVVQRARALPVKGKHGTNDAYVTIQLGKEKFQTSVKEKRENPEWTEECELTIPDGNTSCIILTVLHRNFVGLDKFLGQVQIPLNELEIYERARNRWYKLEGRPGKPNTKPRGELEVKISFTVKSVTGSLLDLSKKPKKTNSLPVKMVHSVGGSLMNLAGKDRKLSHLPKSLVKYGHKVSEKIHLKKSKSNRSSGRIDEQSSEADHDEDRISQISSYNSDEEVNQLPDDITTIPTITDVPTQENTMLQNHNENHEEPDEWQSKLLGIQTTDVRRHTIQGIRSSKPLPDLEEKLSEKVIPETISEKENSEKHSTTITHSPNIQSARQNSSFTPTKVETKSTPKPLAIHSPTEKTPPSPLKTNKSPPYSEIRNEKLHVRNSGLLSKLARDKVEMFEKMSKEDLVELIVCQQSSIDMHLRQIRDLEDYIDNLLVQVMETTPRILQKSYRISPSVRKLISSAQERAWL